MAFSPGVERFIEISVDPDPAPLLSAIAAAECLAKVRTGGITADKFPSTEKLARFLARAFAAHVPMKATAAGLHHAIRRSHPMTYAANSQSAVMHGFANLIFAAALLTAGKIDEDLADALLDDDRPEVFRFGGRAGAWLNAIVTYRGVCGRPTAPPVGGLVFLRGTNRRSAAARVGGEGRALESERAMRLRVALAPGTSRMPIAGREVASERTLAQAASDEMSLRA